MPTINKQAEEQLLSCARATQGFVHEGLAPDEALAKAASDCNLPYHMVPLVANAYNVGVQSYQREKAARAGGGILAATSEFPIARVENVYALLYPSKEAFTKAAAAVADDRVSAEYSALPASSRAYAEKAAAALPGLRVKEAAAEPPRRDPNVLLREAQGQKMAARREVDVVRGEAAAARDAAVQAISEVQAYFKEARGILPQEAYCGAIAKFGNTAEAMFATLFPGKPLVKLAATGPVFESAQPYSLIKTACQALDAAVVAQNKHAALAAALPAKEAALLLPFVHSQPPRDLFSPPAMAPALPSPAGLCKIAGLSVISPIMTGMSAAIGTSLKDQMDPTKQRDSATDSVTSKLDSPDHLAEMQMIQARAVLHDLMRNDPVISGQDPRTVIDAYNEMASVSPSSVTRAAFLRPLLRRRLTAGGLESFDIGEASKIDAEIRKKETEPPGAAGDVGYISGA